MVYLKNSFVSSNYTIPANCPRSSWTRSGTAATKRIEDRRKESPSPDYEAETDKEPKLHLHIHMHHLHLHMYLQCNCTQAVSG